MTKIGVVLVFAIFGVASSFPKGDKAPSEPVQLQNVLENTKRVYDDVIKQLETWFPQTKEIADGFTAQTQKFEKNLDDAIEQINLQIGKNQQKLNATFSKLSDELTVYLTKLEGVIGHNATAEAIQVKTQFEEIFKSVTDNVNKVFEAARPTSFQNSKEKLREFFQTAKDRFMHAISVMKNSVMRTITEAEKMFL